MALHRWDGWFPWLKFKFVDFFFFFGAEAVVSGVALGLHSAPDFRIAPPFFFFCLRPPAPPNPARVAWNPQAAVPVSTHGDWNTPEESGFPPPFFFLYLGTGVPRDGWDFFFGR